MDLLGEKPEFRIDDENARVFSRHENEPPQYVSGSAIVKNSSITEGCEIYGTVINSILGYGVKVEAGACVKDSVLMHHSVVRAGASVNYSILDSDVTVGEGATVGRPKETSKGITVIGTGKFIADGEDISDDQMIYSE